MLLEADRSLPRPDGVSGIEDEPAEAPSEAPSLDELMRDPDVRVVVEAADGLVPVG